MDDETGRAIQALQADIQKLTAGAELARRQLEGAVAASIRAEFQGDVIAMGVGTALVRLGLATPRPARHLVKSLNMIEAAATQLAGSIEARTPTGSNAAAETIAKLRSRAERQLQAQLRRRPPAEPESDDWSEDEP